MPEAGALKPPPEVAKALNALGVGVVVPDCAALANAEVPDPIFEPRKPFEANAEEVEGGGEVELAGGDAAVAGGDVDDASGGVVAWPKKDDFPKGDAEEDCVFWKPPNGGEGFFVTSVAPKAGATGAELS